MICHCTVDSSCCLGFRAGLCLRDLLLNFPQLKHLKEDGMCCATATALPFSGTVPASWPCIRGLLGGPPPQFKTWHKAKRRSVPLASG